MFIDFFAPKENSNIFLGQFFLTYYLQIKFVIPLYLVGVYLVGVYLVINI